MNETVREHLQNNQNIEYALVLCNEGIFLHGEDNKFTEKILDKHILFSILDECKYSCCLICD